MIIISCWNVDLRSYNSSMNEVRINLQQSRPLHGIHESRHDKNVKNGGNILKWREGVYGVQIVYRKTDKSSFHDSMKEGEIKRENAGEKRETKTK